LQKFFGVGGAQFELRRVMDLDRDVSGAAVEHVAAGGPVGGDEMQMITGHVHTAQVVGSEESHDGSFDLVKFEDRLFARGAFEAD